MSETTLTIYGGAKKSITIFEGENDHQVRGSMTIGFENCNSGLLITTTIAKSSEIIPGYEITFDMSINEAYVLLGAIEAYLKMQPKKQELTEL